MNVETKVALADFDGLGLCVMHVDEGYRPTVLLSDTSAAPVSGFINAETLTDILLSAETFGPLVPTRALFKGATFLIGKERFSIEPKQPKPRKVKSEYFPSLGRSATTKLNEAVRVWGYTPERFKTSAFYSVEPLSDWLLSARVLRASCEMLITGKNSEVEKTMTDCFLGRQSTKRASSRLVEFHKRLIEFPANMHEKTELELIADRKLWEDEDTPFSYSPTIHAITNFNVMRSAAPEKMDYRPEESSSGLVPIRPAICGLVLVWNYVFDMFVRERISICPICGKIFIKDRRSKKYCGHACAQKRYESKSVKVNSARKPGTPIETHNVDQYGRR